MQRRCSICMHRHGNDGEIVMVMEEILETSFFFGFVFLFVRSQTDLTAYIDRQRENKRKGGRSAEQDRPL